MKYKLKKWDKKFIELAKLVSTWSKDESTKLGCVIVNSDNRVVSLGYNGIPSNCLDINERQVRPIKYYYMEHAERNAIYNAARLGVSTVGCKLYLNKFFPCADCARAIIQSGITEIICNPKDESREDYKQSWKASLEMFKEAKIKIRTFKQIV